MACARQRFPQLPRERACLLLGLNRGSFYRQEKRTAETVAAEPTQSPSHAQASSAMRLQAAIERIVVEFPGYGYRRVTIQLRREGWPVNHKRVRRLMRAAGLLWRRKRRFVKTTDSAHGFGAAPNLVKGRVPTALNEVWVADLTYIRLGQEFVYLATVMDAFSRRVVGWCLSRRLEAELALGALECALETRQPKPGWIHHSDRGVQYACGAYRERLARAGARASMAAKGTPQENAQAERLFRTLKEEEVYLQEYQTFAEAEASIGRFIEEVYNQKRLHSALGYRPPCEFEELVLIGAL
jgi:transposase InsO family protein